MIGAITVFTSEIPTVLGKAFKLRPDGTLEKSVAGHMSKGTYRTESFANIDALARLLASIKLNEAISASRPVGADAGIVVSERLLATHTGAVTRSKSNFALADAPGLGICDYDLQDGVKPLSQQELGDALLSVCPASADAGVLHWVSGSSCIYNGSHELKGIGGQRLYIMVQSVADWPRALSAINKRLALKGIGLNIKVSSSGSLLVRHLFDSAMGESARLDFAPAGAICTAPIVQRRGLPVQISSGTSWLDTRQAIPDLTAEEEAQYVALVETAKHVAQPEAMLKRLEWRSTHERAAMTTALSKGEDIEQARVNTGRTLDSALGGSLLGSFELIHVDDRGKETRLSVDQILSARERWHLCKFLSPLDPDHRNRSADAIIYADQPQAVLFDLNDTTVYRLLAQPARLAIQQGGRAELANQIADALKTEPDLFTLGGQLVRAVKGAFAPVSRPILSYLIGTKVALYRQGKEKQAAADIDQPTADMVLALLNERANSVTGRASIPLVCTDGRIIQRPGFDPETGIYLDLIPGDIKPIPQAPTRQETVDSLKRLWKPWAAYQWAGPNDRAAMLATVLTIPLRPTVQAAPGLFVDSPLQGSGKSKAVGAVAAVARGCNGGAKSWIGSNEIELGKYLLSTIRTGDPAINFDNVLGTFDSAQLATAIADGRINDRLLGASELKSLDARVMWLASGNNASLARDMGTRWLQARIDTKSEAPHRLSYPYDPVDVALSDRMSIARSAVLVHRTWHSGGAPRTDGINTRFAEWGRVVRQMVLWLQSSGLASEAGLGPLGDPAASILEGSIAADPESESLALLLHGLSESFGCDTFSSSDVAQIFKAGEDSANENKVAVFEGITGLTPRARYGVTTQSIAAVLRNRRDRPTLGMVLTAVPQFGRDVARGTLWRIDSA